MTMRITISGERCEGKTFLAGGIAKFLMLSGFAVEIEESAAFEQAKIPQEDVKPRHVIISVQNDNEKIWNRMVPADKLGKISKVSV